MTSRFFLILAPLLLLGACASGSTLVLEPPTNPTRYSAATIVHGDDTVPMDSQAAGRFEATLSELLYGDGGAFTSGSGLSIHYRFIQLDEGSQAARYFIGLGAGKGELTLEVVFRDASGQEMATIHTGGEISGGFMGGSFLQAIDRAAMETADYANMHFAASPAN